MDEDDSQDELINRCTSQHKRSAVWDISDDSDDAEEESEEEESNSGEDDEEEEEEEEANEDDDDEGDGVDSKAEDGSFGGTSADLAGMSSDEDADTCPICLNSFTSQPVATPENCEHYFCLDCILEWTKNANSCPIDRIAFNSIFLRKSYGGNVKKMITIQKPAKSLDETLVDVDLEQTNCEVCGGSDREDRLLLCDGCDAGYHMECLTPPLDSVPVEEWFCPECEANNHLSGASETSDAERLPSTARHAARRSQAAGTTRAIARTQQSERVRANVNRHRITQARTSQLAPTYLIQSTWLDETINAVIAGLNSSVYVRDLTPRAPQRRRGTTRKRKVKRTSSSAGSKGKAAGKGVRRKKRRGRAKSRKKLALTKTTSRSRIASSLGIGKAKKSSSLPTVYRPSEQTLSGMRADIGAASLSIYGDPCDLDPFVDQDEEGQQAHATSLLEAKRRGISRSALRSHQPVARPVTASLSRRGVNAPRPGAVVEAAPVPDLLGSILSGQSMLMMDSSDVVINRDGSLKATKPAMPAPVQPGCSRSGVLNDACPLISPATPPDPVERYNPVLPPQDHPRLQPPCPGRPTHLSSHTGATGPPRPFSSTHPPPNSSSRSDRRPPADLPCKTPVKPMWEGVSVLPRIPKLKRESGESSGASSNRSHVCASERGTNSYGGDKGRQRSVDQRKGRAEGEAQRSRSDTAGPSPAFSSSFSSSSAGFPANQPHHSSSSSSSSSSSATVSFRINSSGNSWHSRRLSVGASSSGGQEAWKEKKEEAKKKQMRRDKQMLLASRTLGNKGVDGDSIYDPFNPTQSDSSSSEDEAESPGLGSSTRNTAHVRRAASSEDDVKDEPQELTISEEEESRRTGLQDVVSMEVEKASRRADGETEEQTSCDHKVKVEAVEEADTSGVDPSAPLLLKNHPPAPTKKTEKAKARSESGSKSPSRDLSQKDVNSSKERYASGSETDRGGRLDLPSSDHAIREKGKKRDRTHSSGHSGVRKRRSPRSSSESSPSSSPDRTHRRQSRSRSKDRRNSRSSSSSGSRERSQRKKQTHRSREGHEGGGRESVKRRPVKDYRRSRSRSPSQLSSRSRNCKRRTPSKSRSRSRERRKEKTRPPKAASTSRHKGASETNPNRRLRSRSRSRERRKEEGAAKSSQKASGFCLPSYKDVKQVQAKKKEDIAPNLLKEDKGAPVNAQEAPSKDLSTTSQASAPAAAKERVLLKDIKKEKQAAFDMFEESSGSKVVTKVESGVCGLVTIKNEKGFEPEACDISIIKSEPSSPEFCSSAISVSPLIKADGFKDEPDWLQPAPPASGEQPGALEPTANVKQEIQPPSDSDDDFNVDVMLDSLQYERMENTEERGSDQQGTEDSVEGGSVSLSLATKTKNQVKRVTWNIQEPKGPQPEKSPSKLALYKLKLKQEGVRRPPSSQDGSGAGDVSRRSHATVTSFSTSDGALAQKLSCVDQGKEEDFSRKDKYLRKLHMQERAVEEVKLAIKPFYQRRDINKDEYKEILRKAVQKVCHSKSGEINPVKVGNLVKAYVDKYKHARKHKKGEDTGKMQDVLAEALKPFSSP